MVKPITLLFNESSRVTYWPFSGAATGPIVICFGEIDSGLVSEGYGTAPCKKRNLDYLYVAQNKGDQYQRLDPLFFKDLIENCFSGRQFFFSGCSIGGYAAIYFASFFREARVLAFSPRAPGHPLFKPFFRGLYRSVEWRHKELPQNTTDSISKNNIKTIFFDPYNQIDALFFRYLNIYHRFEGVHARYSGHYAAKALLDAGLLDKVFDAFIQCTEYPSVDGLPQEALDFHWARGKQRFKAGLNTQFLEHHAAILGRNITTKNKNALNRYAKEISSWAASSKKRAEHKAEFLHIPCEYLSSDSKDPDCLEISFSGDFIFLRQQLQSFRVGDNFEFEKLFSHTRAFTSTADIRIGVFEGVVADETVCSLSGSDYADGLPLHLNYPPVLVQQLKQENYDILTLAQNHIFDAGHAGFHSTVECFERENLKYVGPKKKGSSLLVYVHSGMKIGFLAYTFKPNLTREADFFGNGPLKETVNILVSPESRWYEESVENVRMDFAEAFSQEIDLLIVLPHMGGQFRHAPDAFQLHWIDVFKSLGADIIFSDHPHATQPVEWFDTNKGKKGFVVHCCGNFVSSYVKHDGDLSYSIKIKLDRVSRSVVGGEIFPMYAHQQSQFSSFIPVNLYDIFNGQVEFNVSGCDYRRVEQLIDVFHDSTLRVKVPVTSSSVVRFSNKYINDNNPLGIYRVPDIFPLLNKVAKKIDWKLFNKGVSFIGDSITHGAKNGGVGWFEPMLANCKYATDVQIVAVDGATSQYFVEHQDVLAALPEGVVFLAFGANDIRYRNPLTCAMSAGEYVSRLDVILNCLPPEVLPVVISPWPSSHDDPVCTLAVEKKSLLYQEYIAGISDLCKRRKIAFLNVHDAIAAEINSRLSQFYLVDSIHPNSTAGVNLYAAEVIKKLAANKIFALRGK